MLLLHLSDTKETTKTTEQSTAHSSDVINAGSRNDQSRDFLIHAQDDSWDVIYGIRTDNNDCTGESEWMTIPTWVNGFC